MKTKIIFILIFLVLCSGTYYSQVQLDNFYKKNQKYFVEKNPLITLPTPIIKRITFGFDNLIADIVWLQFIQYFGENNQLKRNNNPNYDFSYIAKYLDVITTLDPHFYYAYWFGTFAIADEMEDPELAMSFIKKGLKYNPDNAHLFYTAAVVELMYFNDFVDAEKYMKRATQVSPDNDQLRKYYNILASKAKIQEKKRDIWLGIYNDAVKHDDKTTMQRAKDKLEKMGYVLTDV